jgi:hypothetical protein
MKRQLPPTKDLYYGPESVVTQCITTANPKEFALWALAYVGKEPSLVRIVRQKTVETADSKLVFFVILPQGIFLNGVVGYSHPSLANQVVCEWSDFLRLTRWRKGVLRRSPEEQARIAHLVHIRADGLWQLKAADDPIRHLAK